FPLPDFDRATLIAKDNIACVCSLFRKSVWEQVGGYNETMRGGYEDWDFWVGCVEKGWDGSCLHQPLFLYRKSGQSMLSRANQNRERLFAQIVCNHASLYDERTRQWARQILQQHLEIASAQTTGEPHNASSAMNTHSPLRITYLIGSILGVTGGNQTLLRQAEEMRRRGHEVTIVTYTPKPDWFQFQTRVIQVPSGQHMAPFVPQSEVVVATYFSNAPELSSIPAPVKVYYAQGDQYVFEDATLPDTPQNRQRRQLSRASYLLPGIRFVPNSRNLAQAVEKLCGRQPDAILPVCTDQTVFRPLQRPLPRSRFRLLIVGPDARGSEIEPLLFKGIQDIHEALQILAQRSPNFTAIRMSGTPPDIFTRFPCEFYVAPSDEMKTMLFGTSHILVYASHYDSCPRPPQEAMAAGCAVVCTATGGALEYCRDGENALLVPIQSPAAIAEAIERLMKEPALREKLVQGGLATARAHPREREWNEWESMLYRFVDEAARKASRPASVPVAPPKPANSTPVPLPLCAKVGNLDNSRALLGRQEFAAAWQSAAAALELRPFHPEAWLLLAEIARAAGDAAGARQCAQQARDLAPDWKAPGQFLQKKLKGSKRPDWLALPKPMANRLTVCLITKNE
ncbi:MAG TPA: glycosyltransferase, partial [Candidatus Sulfotelmatobacter sp.]|nr:glycosyltransferase [Candidatus Sulfotelmatobacter sp.]